GLPAYVAPKLPDGMDPDEFILQHGIEAWRSHIDQAIHAYRFAAKRILENGRLDTDAGRDAVIAAAMHFARGCGHDRRDELHRHFWPEIVQATGADASLLQDLMEKATRHEGNGNFECGEGGSKSTDDSQHPPSDDLWQPAAGVPGITNAVWDDA